ncbi:lipopolysaccharide biosynthesis protein [Kytococcus sedentarius]|uniref:lipopolysaccharide biosynthesis protein n=1 Tax=Kytococcus sedentarius TaxID=1276 RepID=UPI0035BC0590
MASSMVASLVFAFTGYTYVRGLYLGLRRIKMLVAIEVPLTIIGVLGTIAVAANNPGTHELTLIPLTVVYLLMTAACWPWNAWAGEGDPSAEVRGAMGFVAWSGIGTMAASGTLFAGMLIATHYDTVQRAALYAITLTLLGPMSMVANSISMGLMPNMSHFKGAGSSAEAEKLARDATRRLVLIMSPLYVALACTSPLLISLFWGLDFTAAYIMLAVASVGPLLRSIAQPAIALIASDGDARTTGLSALRWAILAVALWGLAPFIGGAWAAVLGYSAPLAGTSLYLMRKGFRQINDPWASGAITSLALYGTALGAVGATVVLDWSPLLPLPLIGVGICLGWAVLNRSSLMLLRRRLG